MPNWKKVITSGSDASLNTLTVTSGITGNASSATTSAYIRSADTRAVASTPETNDATQGIRFDFKQNSTNGLSDGGTYNGVMYFRKYGTGTDWSGGGAHEIGFSDNGNLHHRYGTSTAWGSWYKILDSNNYNSYSPTLTGTGATGTWGINISGNATTATSATSATSATAADTVKTVLVTTNATHYIPFVPDNNISATAEALGTVATLTYNPNSGTFGASKIVADQLTGSFNGPINGVAAQADTYYIDSAASGIWNVLGSQASGYTQAENLPFTYNFSTGVLNVTASYSLASVPGATSIPYTALQSGGSAPSGRILIGNTTSGFSLASITPGTGISIVSGSGAITINATNNGTVTSVATSGTVSGITLTGGTITSSGTITLGGSISGLTTSNLSATAGITNGQLANSSITLNGTARTLGTTSIIEPYVEQDLSTNATRYLTFVDSSTAGYQRLNLDTGLTYNPSTNALTATTFVGALSGNASTATSATSATTATTATNVGITNTTTGTGPYYITFSSSNGVTNALRVDSSGLTYNATTNTLTVANLSGNASSATSAGSVTNAVTFNNGGSGAASGTTFNGSAARTISYNTIGAPKADGTGASGTWGIAISGNAATATSATSATSATTATNANNINISATTSTDTTTSVVLVGSQATGNQSPFIDSG